MPSRSSIVPVEVLREAVRLRVGETSLRITGEEIGLSKKGVDKFLAGSSPHSATIKKLTDWYLRRVAAADEEPSAETVQAALAVLVRHLPAGERQELKDALIDLVALGGVEKKAPTVS